MNKKSANSVEINKTPKDIRYIFITKFANGDVRTATSWRTFSEHMSWEADHIRSIHVVDLVKDALYNIPVGLRNELLDSWRQNYHDFRWDIPFQFYK
jgi:hypothetical protein